MVSLFGLSYCNWCVGCVLLSHFGLICTFLITIDIDSFPMLVIYVSSMVMGLFKFLCFLKYLGILFSYN